MMRQIEDLKLKAEQGSQQTQGEVQELELEKELAALFPFDEILPVPKGINGADVVQKVRDGIGRECGVIIWESKQTKAWSQGWVQKLKEDQRQVKAEMAIIVSKMLPGEIKTFGDIEGIYVTNFESIFGVASVLRLQLIQITATKRSLKGKECYNPNAGGAQKTDRAGYYQYQRYVWRPARTDRRLDADDSVFGLPLLDTGGEEA